MEIPLQSSYGEKYQGGRVTYTLIRETWRWVNDDLGLDEEAEDVEKAFE